MLHDISTFRENLIDDSLNLSENELKINTEKTSQFFKLMYKALINNQKILIVGDYDVDGFFSTIILKQYLSLLESRVNATLNSKVDTYYTKREHGYNMPVNVFNEHHNNYDLIIFLDTGSSCEYFTKDTQKVLVIDHHPISTNVNTFPYIYNPNTNNEISTSTGKIVYDMIENFEKHLKEVFGKKAIKEHDVMKLNKIFAGVTLSSDMADMSFENKKFLNDSLSLMSENKNILLWLNKVPHSNVTSLDLGFNLINYINSYSRMGNDLKDIENIFLMGVDRDNLFANVSSREIVSLLNILEENHTLRKSVVESLNKKYNEIFSNETDSDFLAFVIENEYTGINGLLSQNILNSRLKSNIVLSYDKNRDCYVGSGRGKHIKDLISKVATDNVEFKKNTQFGGHEVAIGISVAKESVEKFVQKVNSTKLDIAPKDLTSEISIYSSPTIADFKDAIERYATLSPQTMLSKRYYAVISNYENLGIIQKKDWYTSTIVDNTAMLTIYFKENQLEEIKNNAPIVVEIVNMSGLSNHFIQKIDLSILNQKTNELGQENTYNLIGNENLELINTYFN